jgi:hypothetical protein
MTPDIWFGLLLGLPTGALVTLAAVKYGEWLAMRALDEHLAAALHDRRPSSLPDHRDIDVSTLDAMDTYLDALDRKRQTRDQIKRAH